MRGLDPTARDLDALIDANYGVVMPAYLGQLVPRKKKLAAEVHRLVDQFVAAVTTDPDPWERRFAEKFGLPFAAAVLLSKFHIAPWSAKRAKVAILHMYRVSRAASVHPQQATDDFLARVKSLVSKKAIVKLAKGVAFAGQNNRIRAVIRDIGARKDVIVIPPATFKSLMKPAAALNLVERELERQKLLLKDPDGNRRRQVMIKGLVSNRRRCIYLLLPTPPKKTIFR